MTDPNDGSAYYFTSLLFKNKKAYLQDQFKKNKCEDIVTKFKGKTVYYGLKDKYNYDIMSNCANATEIRRTNDMVQYRIKEGAYECIGFDIHKRHNKNYGYPIPFAILRDKNGVCFKTPAVRTPIEPSFHNTIYCERFDKYFVLKEEVDSIIKLRIEAESKTEILKNNKLKLLTKEYGKSYADFLIQKDASTIERFRNLAKKYGKQNAKTIIEERVRIGWSKEMCREAWGKPDDINRTIGSWGTHEQWVYGKINCNYLYFENGILTSIQN